MSKRPASAKDSLLAKKAQCLIDDDVLDLSPDINSDLSEFLHSLLNTDDPEPVTTLNPGFFEDPKAVHVRDISIRTQFDEDLCVHFVHLEKRILAKRTGIVFAKTQMKVSIFEHFDLLKF